MLENGAGIKDDGLAELCAEIVGQYRIAATIIGLELGADSTGAVI
jgi:hypothetical protein